MAEFRAALEDMVFQFGYRGTKNGKPVIRTGGLSALEDAFEALGWPDPKYLPEEGYTCEIEGCMNEDTSGVPWEGLYVRLCFEHFAQYCEGKPRPPVKHYAIHRSVD